MGNVLDCTRKCFGRVDRRSYIKSRYRIEEDFAVEFENLMDETNDDERRRLLTDEEKRLLSNKQYDKLLEEQTKFDTHIDNQLAKQEDDIRVEEESYYEAKREAARLANIQRRKEQKQKESKKSSAEKAWVADDEWDIAGGEEDFELFLENVRARSLSPSLKDPGSRQYSQSACRQNSSYLRKEPAKHKPAPQAFNQKPSPKTDTAYDLDWEYEHGVVTNSKEHAGSNIKPAAVAPSQTQGGPSEDFEWDNEFVSADTTDDPTTT